MIRVFVDSSAWFAALHREDPDHTAAGAALKRWEGRLVTHDFVFDEALTLARSRAGHALACKLGEYLRDPELLDLVRVTSEDQDLAWERFRRDADKDYSFTDCVSFVVMRRLHIDLAITLDRDFRQAGFETEPESPGGWGVAEGPPAFGPGDATASAPGPTRGRPRAASPSSRKKAPPTGRAKS